MESRSPGKLQITVLRYDSHIVARLFVLHDIPDYLALTANFITKFAVKTSALSRGPNTLAPIHCHLDYADETDDIHHHK